MPRSPLTQEDREVARLIWRIVLVFYSSTAVALSAWIVGAYRAEEPEHEAPGRGRRQAEAAGETRLVSVTSHPKTCHCPA